MTLPHTTNKQQEILLLIPKFRFLNRVQIQRFLNHKYPKLINDWLRDLKENNYLEWIYSTEFEKKSKPAIYYSGLNLVRFLKTKGDFSSSLIQKLYREKGRSENFIDQCILIAECFLSFRDQSSGSVVYQVTTSSDFEKDSSPFHFLTDLIPHLVIKKSEVKNDRKITKYYLLENFEPTLPRYSIRKRLRNYLDFYFSSKWENHISKTFPILLFICPDKPFLIYAKRFAKKLLDENQNPTALRFRFATAQDVKKFTVTADIWEEAGKRYDR